eukprot:SAG31_NODE_2912_length_4920_cov_3.413192_4_plen_59_part_00
MHGSDDDEVPLSSAEKIAEEWGTSVHGAIEAKLVVLDGDDHGVATALPRLLEVASKLL